MTLTPATPHASSPGAAVRHVISAGYVALDVIVDEGSGTITHGAGGTAGNVAAALAWLGLPSSLMARLGSDPAGMAVRWDLIADGVDVTHVAMRDDVQSPAVAHHIDAAGSHRFSFTCPTCGRRFPRHRPPAPQQAVAVPLDAQTVFFFDRASSTALKVAAQVRDAGGLVVFEPNGPGRPTATATASSLASILKLSQQRVESIYPRLESVPGQVQILTSGAAGLRWRRGGSAWRTETALPAPSLVDDAGAGDWTTAGLLSVLARSDGLADQDLRRGLRFGQALAALSVGYTGARGLSRALGAVDVLRQADGLLAGAETPAPTAAGRRAAPRLSGATCGTCLYRVASGESALEYGS